MKVEDIQKLKEAITVKKLYKKKDIAEAVGISLPTVDSRLKALPDLEALRQENKPDRAAYLREYCKTYERQPRSLEYYKQYREKNKDKINERWRERYKKINSIT